MTVSDRPPPRISQPPPPPERVDSFDLVILGAGPAGEKAAAQAASFGKTVALVERGGVAGAAAVHTGTLPSKTLRESALFLSGRRSRELPGLSVELAKGATVRTLAARAESIASRDSARMRAKLERLGVRYYQGTGKFEDAHTLVVDGPVGVKLRARYFLIATGSEPNRPRLVPFASPRVHDTNGIVELEELPPTLVILGAGVVGCEYACTFAALGTKVTLVDTRREILPFLDREIVQRLVAAMENLGITFIPAMKWGAIHAFDDLVTVDLADGRTLDCDHLLYAAGRTGRSWGIGLERIGIMPDGRGYIAVDDSFRTEVEHIFAAGDVIGPPAQASTAMEQGRVAVCKAFGFDVEPGMARLLPFGVYAIPELSGVGETEQTCQKKGLSYVVGRALHGDEPRGMIAGDLEGMTKLVVERGTRRILGVHVIGEHATELVHIGQTAIQADATVDLLVDMVWNHPTVAEAHKHAAADALRELARE